LFGKKMKEESSLGIDSLSHYQGNTLIHVGELFGETLSPHPWGITTSSKFQLALLKEFRLVRRVQLPNWPGLKDFLSVWKRVAPPVECDGALFHYFGPS
jgi:hypothetical protein